MKNAVVNGGREKMNKAQLKNWTKDWNKKFEKFLSADPAKDGNGNKYDLYDPKQAKFGAVIWSTAHKVKSEIGDMNSSSWGGYSKILDQGGWQHLVDKTSGEMGERYIRPGNEYNWQLIHQDYKMHTNSKAGAGDSAYNFLKSEFPKMKEITGYIAERTVNIKNHHRLPPDSKWKYQAHNGTNGVQNTNGMRTRAEIEQDAALKMSDHK